MNLVERFKAAVTRIQAVQPDNLNEKCLKMFNEEAATDLESWASQLELLQRIATDWDGRFPPGTTKFFFKESGFDTPPMEVSRKKAEDMVATAYGEDSPFAKMIADDTPFNCWIEGANPGSLYTQANQ